MTFCSCSALQKCVCRTAPARLTGRFISKITKGKLRRRLRALCGAAQGTICIMGKTCKIVVCGSFITDLAVYTPRFPRDGESIVGKQLKTGPGGKGSNQATAANRSGAEVVMLTKLGKDAFSTIARDHYTHENMTQKYVYEDANAETGSAVIEINEQTGENRIIVMLAANDLLTVEEVDAAEEEIRTCDAVLVQLEANLDATAEALRLAKKYHKLTVMNPAPAHEVPLSLFDGVDFITPNETETEFFSGIKVTDEASAFAAGHKLIDSLNVGHVVITLGKKGAAVVGKDFEFVVPTTDLKPVDTTGAGDAFNGGLTVALAEGRELEDAVKFANCVGSIAVTRKGSSPAMPYREETEALYERFYSKK